MENNKESPYLDIYKQKKYLVLKISGELLENEKFYEFVQYIKYLREEKIPIILVYGGGNQISKEYKENTGKDRKKGKDGKNFTTKEILDNGVIPADESILKKLIDVFGEKELNVFRPKDINAEKISGLGEVGAPLDFNKNFELNKINIVPFIGQELGTTDLLNINADDIVEKISKDFSNKISNIIFLTGTGGLLDKELEVVSFLSKKKLREVLEGIHKKIKIDGGMFKKLESIYKILENGVTKTTTTNLEGLKDEIESIEGSGTMFVDLKTAKFKELENPKLFNMIYETQILNGNWKERDKSSIEKISKNYIVLELGGTILGGYYLGDFKIEINGKKLKGKLLESLFVSKNGGGIGYTLGEEIKKENKPIFAYTKKGGFFEKLGFKKVEGIKSETGADLYILTS